MNLKLVLLFITLFFINNAGAITTADLPLPLTSEVELIVSEINPIESLCIDWSPLWTYSIKKDSVITILYQALNKTELLPQTSFENTLLKGIIWQYLYQVDVDTAFLKVEEISNQLQKQFPNKFEGSWLKGINLILGAKIDSGFKLIDHIHRTNENLPDNFYSDYIKLSELIFLPKQLSSIDKWKNLDLNILPFKVVNLNIDERLPVKNSWTVTNDIQKPASFPLFTFSADFSLKNSFKINYPSLNRYKKFSMKIPIKTDIQKDLLDSLIYNPDAPPIKMTMKVLVDKLDSLESIESYILKFVYKQYDEITPLKLKYKNMIALKCHNKSIIRGMDDQYTVYFAFDKPLSLKNKNIFGSKIDHSNPSTIRYVVALTTSGNVEDKADMLLYELAERLIL